jgi:hypothetical protein
MNKKEKEVVKFMVVQRLTSVIRRFELRLLDSEPNVLNAGPGDLSCLVQLVKFIYGSTSK